jgi:hypothetical protein
MEHFQSLYSVIMSGEPLAQERLDNLSSAMRTLMVSVKQADKWSVRWEANLGISLKEVASTLVEMGFPDGYVTQDGSEILWARSND